MDNSKDLDLTKMPLEKVKSELYNHHAPNSVTSLKLICCDLTADDATELAENLRRFPSLETLDLSMNPKLGAGTALIIMAVPSAVNINLSLCGIKNEHSKQLSARLRKLKKLKTLNLLANWGLDEGILDIIKACQNLEELFIHYEIPTGLISKLRSELAKCEGLFRYDGLSETCPESVLIRNSRINKNGIAFFKMLLKKYEFNELTQQEAHALQIRLRYIVDKFDYFESCEFDKSELEGVLWEFDNGQLLAPEQSSHLGNSQEKNLSGVSQTNLANLNANSSMTSPIQLDRSSPFFTSTAIGLLFMVKGIVAKHYSTFDHLHGLHFVQKVSDAAKNEALTPM